MGFFDILRKIFKRNTDQLLLDVGTPVYGKFEHGEIGLPMTDSKLILPCGIYGRWEA